MSLTKNPARDAEIESPVYIPSANRMTVTREAEEEAEKREAEVIYVAAGNRMVITK